MQEDFLFFSDFFGTTMEINEYLSALFARIDEIQRNTRITCSLATAFGGRHATSE
jgi:hypothetical protein